MSLTKRRLTKEQRQALRDTGVAWCNEQTFESILDDLDAADAEIAEEKELTDLLNVELVESRKERERLTRENKRLRTALENIRGRHLTITATNGGDGY